MSIDRLRRRPLQGFGSARFHLGQLDSSNIEDTDRIEVAATMAADHREGDALEQIVGRLSLEPVATTARRRAETMAE